MKIIEDLYDEIKIVINKNGKDIIPSVKDLERPFNSYAVEYLDYDKWNGFDIHDDTELIVLDATSEGEEGDGVNSCALMQKGVNYHEVENFKKNEKITIITNAVIDTLETNVVKYYGTGSKWKTIYTANKSLIEKTARKYGKKSSSNGHWIYPGTKLTIPVTSKVKQKVYYE